MFGLFFSFVIPGILVGCILSVSFLRAKAKARFLEEQRARQQKKQLYVYDLREDYASVGQAVQRAA